MSVRFRFERIDLYEVFNAIVCQEANTAHTFKSMYINFFE